MSFLLVYSISVFMCSVAALLAWNPSKELVYAYYVLRTITNILTRGSIFCIAVAYTVSISLNQYDHGYRYWY